MAEIRAFRAWRFSPEAGEPATITCPPYDIISEEQRQAYLQTNPHNIIRLELPRDGADPYAQAGEVLRGWIADGTLRRDDAPALYVYEIGFDTAGMDGCFGGGKMSVAGLIAQVHLEEFSKGIVLPHEETLSKAKADRFQLMCATGFNFSNIYSLYNDAPNAIPTADILAEAMKAAPLCEMTDEAGLTHRLWGITDPARVKEICRQFADTKLYIADGHHRYETAINYRNHLREQGVPVGADSDYVMMMLVEMSHPGLVVFPTHRLLRDLPSFDEAALVKACEKDFDVARCALENTDCEMEAAYNAGKKRFALYTGGNEVTLLTLKDEAAMAAAMPEASEASRGLDVNVLHTLILEQLLGIDRENMKNQINLTYTRSRREALDGVCSGQYQACILLNPTRVSEIRDVAAAGEKMPQKSTYFYPKLITGLTMNSLTD